jgi:excisionase family DNA binding protein
MAMIDQKYLTPKEVAERLQVTVQTVYRWIQRHGLPAVRVGGKVYRIGEKELDVFLESRKTVRRAQ